MCSILSCLEDDPIIIVQSGAILSQFSNTISNTFYIDVEVLIDNLPFQHKKKARYNTFLIEKVILLLISHIIEIEELQG